MHVLAMKTAENLKADLPSQESGKSKDNKKIGENNKGKSEINEIEDTIEQINCVGSLRRLITLIYFQYEVNSIDKLSKRHKNWEHTVSITKNEEKWNN